jgi:transcriptional regulator with XRE-family HTH domain
MADNNRFKLNEPQSHWRKRLMEIMRGSSEDHPPTEVNVGRRLQELRMMQGLSQRALAEMSGLNFNTLSLIENEKTSPNVSTLQQLSSALSVPITAFFESISENHEIVFQKVGERQQIPFPQGKFEDLGGGLALGEATPLLMILNPNEESDPNPISHSGQEFVYCLEGCIAFWVGEEKCLLESGDSLIFDAQIPHHWENQSDQISRSILIICPSDYDDRSVTQHLPKFLKKPADIRSNRN